MFCNGFLVCCVAINIAIPMNVRTLQDCKPHEYLIHVGQEAIEVNYEENYMLRKNLSARLYSFEILS